MSKTDAGYDIVMTSPKVKAAIGGWTKVATLDGKCKWKIVTEQNGNLLTVRDPFENELLTHPDKKQ